MTHRIRECIVARCLVIDAQFGVLGRVVHLRTHALRLRASIVRRDGRPRCGACLVVVLGSNGNEAVMFGGWLLAACLCRLVICFLAFDGIALL